MTDALQGFRTPVNAYRPKIRWWLPGAFVENSEIAREIKWMKDAGFGGAEIIYFFPMPTSEVDPSDYAKYDFGLDQWNDRMKAALVTAIELDFQLDFTVGPLWPIVTPAIHDKDDANCTHGLHIGRVTFNDFFKGTVPESETLDTERARKLVAVTAAKKNEQLIVGKQLTLELESVVNLTTLVSGSGTTMELEWIPPTEGEWQLFAFWSQTNGQMSHSTTPLPVVDHFSSEATEAVLEFWENRLFGDAELRALYEQNAGCLFCDSIEINATMLGGMYGATPMPVALWSPNLLSEFHARRGYDITPYLPTLFVKGLYQMCGLRPSDEDSEYDFSVRSTNARIRNDYFLTLSEMFRDNHLRKLREWANGHRMQLRYQTYGLPTDLTVGLREVDIPETESLGFGDSTDGYRLQAGAVHIENKPIYSIEVGAVQGYGYKQTWTGKDYGLLWQIHQSFAAGVNQAVLHGMSYQSKSAVGPYSETAFQWPGLSFMAMMFSNEWGERQPISLHTRDLVDYVARNQFMLRYGSPKVDLAIYRNYIDGIHQGMGTKPELTLYEKAGYSYDYISPGLLELDHADVGVFDEKPALAADGPAYKALIVDLRKVNMDNGGWMPSDMSLETADRLIAYADAGLPIVIVREGATRVSSYMGDGVRMETNDDELRIRMNRLKAMPTVRIAASRDEITEALEQLSVAPSARFDGSRMVLSARRYDSGANYYYLYNSSLEHSFDGEVVLTGKGRGYLLDAWNGAIQTVDAKPIGAGETAVKLRLAPNSTVLIAITPEWMVTEDLATEKDGKVIELNRWSLDVDSWSAGSVPTETKIKHITLELNELQPWKDISALRNVSGVGRYRTTVVLENSAESLAGAILDLGELCDTYRLTVNGNSLPVSNQIDRRVRIGKRLREGANEIEIEVATPLNNALSVTDPKRELQAYGLLGPVVLSF